MPDPKAKKPARAHFAKGLWYHTRSTLQVKICADPGHPLPHGGRASDDNGAMTALTIEVPRRGLVVLVGVSGSGKSHFAARCFLPTEVLSSDRFRAMIADD